MNTDGYLLLPVPPKSKGGSGSKVPTKSGRMLNSRAYKDWAERVGWWMLSLHERKLTGRVKFEYVYVVPDLKRRDLADNATSGVLDCASGILIEDDCMIFEIHGYKVLDRELKEARLYFKFEGLPE